jgi:hypothetical protein
MLKDQNTSLSLNEEMKLQHQKQAKQQPSETKEIKENEIKEQNTTTSFLQKRQQIRKIRMELPIYQIQYIFQ